MKKAAKKVRALWFEMLTGEFSPQGIALGFACGTAIALFPTFGFGVVLGLLLALLIPSINKPAIFLAFAVWNPFVLVFTYALSYWFGTLIFGDMPIVKYEIEFLNQFYTLTRRFLIGNIIVTVAFSALSYMLVYVGAKAFLFSRNTK